ncbi:class I SAM-dependent methyltransferase [Peptostreptococcus anaerobius]|uniref:class I SAM-dependent methyltransferase n=1 Tax=Peptostreptococcus anaerobius TaxID=1261 RepID=UPI00321954DB
MEDYKQLSAESKNYSIDLRLSKKGKVFFSKKSQKNQIKINTSHNKKKNYILEEGMDIPALKDLGVFTKDGKVVNSRYDKYKQINRFVELIDHEIKNISEDYQKGSDKCLHILDFGCGKSYLTFVLYYYFTEIKNMNVKITGLDLKKDVIDYCNDVAEKYGYDQLRFELGDINGYKYENKVDMVITLHACDTATDYAIYNAIKWKAKMIFSVPCCQHEINASIRPSSLNIISRYGIIQERVSALLTDSVRANILEALGYKTQLLEFIDIAHSPKNLLIRDVKTNISQEKKAKSLSEVEALRSEFNFDQTLYKLCKDDQLI